MTSNQVMMAVLALDVYNRGPDTKVDVKHVIGQSGDSNGEGYSLGRAVNVSLTQDQSMKDHGFMASVYNFNGNKVISYRGTDFNNAGGIDLFTTAAFNAAVSEWNTYVSILPIDVKIDIFDREQFHRTEMDFINGYAIGLGIPLVPQFFDAISTYLNVVKTIDPNYNLYTDTAQSNVILTGQSMGGGIAGLISMLTGAPSVVYENMSYRDAGQALLGLLITTGSISQGVYDQRIGASGSIVGHYVDGEVLEYLRLFTGTIESTSGPLISYPNITGTHEMDGIHGQAMMVMDIFFSEKSHSSEWYESVFKVFSHINDADVTDCVQVSTPGLGTSGDKLTSMIAYTVIDDGDPSSRPFGDVAIRALENDVDDMVYMSNMASSGTILGMTTDAFSDAFAKIIISYAGVMAQNRAFATPGYFGPGGPLVQGAATVFTNAITFDFSMSHWDRYAAALRTPGFKEIYDSVMSSFGLVTTGAVNDGLIEIYHEYEIIEAASRFSYMFRPNMSWSPTVVAAGEGVHAFFGTEQSDAINGSSYYDSVLGVMVYGDEIIVGGGGDDVIRGEGGNDVIIGGEGSDRLTGGAGNDALFGGAGNDFLYFGGQPNAAPYQRDIWDGGAGMDTLDFTGIYYSGVVINLTDSSRTATILDGDGTHYVQTIASMSAFVGTAKGSISSIEYFVGTANDDLFFGNGMSTYDGGEGNDTFHIKAGDHAYGGGGNDVFYLEAGAIANGGSGVDQLHYVLDSDWTHFSVDPANISSDDEIFLEWEGRSLFLSQGVPQSSYYVWIPPTISIDKVGTDVVVSQLQNGNGRVSTYDTDGTVEVAYMGQGVMGRVWGSVLEFGSGYKDLLSKAVVEQGSFFPELETALMGISEVGYGIRQSALLGTSYYSVMDQRMLGPSASTYGLSLLDKMLVVGAEVSPSGELIGPQYSFGTPINDFFIDDSHETRGTMIFGPSGMTNGLYSTVTSNEYLTSGSGNDLLVAGLGMGSHVLNSGAGADVLYGRSGNDVLNAGGGNDIIVAGGGDDVIDGGSGIDTLTYLGMASRISVTVGAAGGSVHGVSSGSDTFTGIEMIVGTAGDDSFTGGRAGVVMFGADGNDTFNMSDRAIARGGAGADKFYVQAGETVLILDVDSQDQIFVGGVRVTGLDYTFGYERRNETSDGSYDVIEVKTVSSSHMNGVAEKLIMHHHGVLNYDDDLNQIISNTIQGQNGLLMDGDRVRLDVGGATIYMTGYMHQDAGLSYETPISRTGHDVNSSMGLATTAIPSLYGNGYMDQMPLLQPVSEMQTLFGLI